MFSIIVLGYVNKRLVIKISFVVTELFLFTYYTAAQNIFSSKYASKVRYKCLITKYVSWCSREFIVKLVVMSISENAGWFWQYTLLQTYQAEREERERKRESERGERERVVNR